MMINLVRERVRGIEFMMCGSYKLVIIEQRQNQQIHASPKSFHIIN